jgi:ABC-type transport system involved in multi-copper enzyme maturation permease subunit
MTMVWSAFRSEWVKLRRPTLLWPTFLGLAAAASLFSVLLFSQAPATGTKGDLPSLVELAQPDGLIHGLTRAAVLLGIVAFGIAAAQIASEYTLGTLRQLLVRQPRRAIVLAGKYLAVVSFLVGAVVFASVLSGAASVVMAHARGVSTSAWTSSTGIHDLTQALGNMVLAVIGFATLGLVVGLVLRSSVAAVIVGFAWLIPFESVIGVILKGANRWLPGELLGVVAQGGNSTASYLAALATLAVYLGAALAVAFTIFVRRDVTA